jgi:hypothetical protein
MSARAFSSNSQSFDRDIGYDLPDTRIFSIGVKFAFDLESLLVGWLREANFLNFLRQAVNETENGIFIHPGMPEEAISLASNDFPVWPGCHRPCSSSQLQIWSRFNDSRSDNKPISRYGRCNRRLSNWCTEKFIDDRFDPQPGIVEVWLQVIGHTECAIQKAVDPRMVNMEEPQRFRVRYLLAIRCRPWIEALQMRRLWEDHMGWDGGQIP